MDRGEHSQTSVPTPPSEVRRMPRSCVAVITGCVLLLSVAASAADYPLKPYTYTEDFEDSHPAISLWAENGPSTVNSIGLSDEQAFEGKKSLKIDISLEGGSYHYYGAQLRVPCAGKLKLTARVYVADGTTTRVGFGTNMNYPPTHHSGCGSSKSFDKPTGKWELVEIDLVERGESGKAQVMSKYTATARGEDVGAYLDRWSLFIYGGAGKRATVYIDDLRIEGEIPEEADYDRDIQQRWQAGENRLAGRIKTWRADLAGATAALDAMGETPADLEADVAAVRANIDKAGGLIDTLAKRGYGARADVDGIQAAIFTAQHGPETIKAVATARDAGQPYLIYAPRAMSNDRMVADTYPIPAPIAKELACAGSRGEYESISAAVYALEDVENLLVSVSDLAGPAGTIPSAEVDVFAVKSWYQAGRSISDKSHKMLVPELLLKDDELVRVDLAEEQNYLRSTHEDGTTEYLLCSGKTSEQLADVRPIDTDELQPVDIPAKTLKQFWLRVHIPDDAEAGAYAGTVRLTTPAGTRELPLTVTVHPFELLPSRLIYSIYYRAKLSADDTPTITSELRSEEQYRAEIEDMKAHGVLYPTNYQGWSDTLLPRVMEIRQEVGMPTEQFYNLGRNTGNTDDPQKLAALQRDIEKWVEFCGEYGYEDVYFYGIDEARGDRLKSQRTTWKAVQDAGGKTFVACYLKTFEAMGDLLDLAVLAGRPIVLWKAGFDGAMDYAYQHGFGHVWNDFDSTAYRDHNFTYPTVDGVVGTMQWDGFREAVDDVRYVTTLEQAIEKAPADRAAPAAEAGAWLEALDPDTADLYAVRKQMVDWITKLQ